MVRDAWGPVEPPPTGGNYTPMAQTLDVAVDDPAVLGELADQIEPKLEKIQGVVDVVKKEIKG